MSQSAKATSGDQAVKRAKRRTDEMTESCQKVVAVANAIRDSLDDRHERATTSPFYKIDDVIESDEDSLVTSIENVIASASKKD